MERVSVPKIIHTLNLLDLCMRVRLCESPNIFFRKLYFVLTLITTLLRLKAALIRGEHPCYSC